MLEGSLIMFDGPTTLLMIAGDSFEVALVRNTIVLNGFSSPRSKAIHRVYPPLATIYAQLLRVQTALSAKSPSVAFGMSSPGELVLALAFRHKFSPFAA